MPPLVCDRPDDVASVEALPGWRLRVRFHDGVAGVVEMERQVHAADAGVFAALADLDRFRDVGVAWGAVSWPIGLGLDLAPDAMHAQLKAYGVWTL